MADNNEIQESRQSQKEKIAEITSSIETGIKEMFESEKYKSYLQCMSKFHNYSLNNTILIALQNPNAKQVAGFSKWKNSFGRFVKKGEKGIKIFAPTPYTTKTEREKIDPITKVPVLDENGNVEIIEEETTRVGFKITTVFDVDQTYGKEFPTLAENIVGNVENYEDFIEAIKRTSDVPMFFEPLDEELDGYFSTKENKIVIREGMSEAQTISAIIHELAHSILHKRDAENVIDEATGEMKNLVIDRQTEEVEAESISYAVCNYYGIETSDNAFGYIAAWSENKELPELKKSLETINKTSSNIITGIDKHFDEIMKMKNKDLVQNKSISINSLTYKVYNFIAKYNNIVTNNKDVHLDEIRLLLNQGNTSGLKDFIESVGDMENAENYATDINSLIDEYADNNYPEKLAYKIDDYYVSIEVDDDGFTHNTYDEDYNIVNNGTIESYDKTIYENAEELFNINTNSIIGHKNVEELNFDKFMDKVNHIEEKFQAEENPFEVDETPVQNNDIEKPNTSENIEFDSNYPMPDPSISIDERNEYGYTSNEILPLQKEKALEFFENYATVYALYSDNLKLMINSDTDIINHQGIFGIEVSEWENDWDFIQAAANSQEVQQEQAVQVPITEQEDTDKNSFTIYQLKDDDSTRDYRFESLANLDKAGLEVNAENYDITYTREITDFSSTSETLNSLFQEFNMNRPEDFKGHSMSVSDVIEFKIDGDVTHHYVDRTGFSALENFTQNIQEKSPFEVEQNQIEQEVQSGENAKNNEIIKDNTEKIPDDYLTGERISTPRGSFSLTSMTKEELDKVGYGFSHNSEDGKYMIYGNGMRAFAVSNNDNVISNEFNIQENQARSTNVEQENQLQNTNTEQANKLPTVAELQKDVSEGKSISILDLAMATRNEKKQANSENSSKQTRQMSTQKEQKIENVEKPKNKGTER